MFVLECASQPPLFPQNGNVRPKQVAMSGWEERREALGDLSDRPLTQVLKVRSYRGAMPLEGDDRNLVGCWCFNVAGASGQDRNRLGGPQLCGYIPAQTTYGIG